MIPLITRRRWTGFLIATPLIAQITSTVPPTGQPAPPKDATTPQERLQKAYADVRQVSDRLSKIEVPMNVEPAFFFRP
ncbi:MAG: hypothetical protein JO210_10400 [Acidobacteriaceae bacterium]|nr:hypothetical protein [Acidobacteriaceae bacterium]